MTAPLTLATWPTPLEAAPRLAAALGLGPEDLWVKRDDLVGLGGGGNKVRKLEATLAVALAQGATAVVTSGAAQSNHARLTAAAGARLGLDVTLVLAGDPPTSSTGNLLLDELLGARLVWAGPTSLADLDGLVEQEAERLREAGHRDVRRALRRIQRGRGRSVRRGGSRDPRAGAGHRARGDGCRLRRHHGRDSCTPSASIACSVWTPGRCPTPPTGSAACSRGWAPRRLLGTSACAATSSVRGTACCRRRCAPRWSWSPGPRASCWTPSTPAVRRPDWSPESARARSCLGRRTVLLHSGGLPGLFGHSGLAELPRWP